MCRKIILTLVFCLLGLVGNSLATVRNWDDGGSDYAWDTAENWSGDTIPASSDEAQFNLADSTCGIGESVTANCSAIKVGYGDGPCYLHMAGGDLSVASDRFIIGYGASSDGIVKMTSGTIDIEDSTLGHLAVGWNWGAKGTLDMYGGMINVRQWLTIPQYGGVGGATGIVNLHGGIINCTAFAMASGGELDVWYGKLIISGDKRTTIDGYITNGWITAFGGDGTIEVDYNNVNPGKTTVYALQATYRWDDLGTDSLWDADMNWDCDDAPISSTKAILDVDGGSCLIDSSVRATCSDLSVGYNESFDVNITGGSLSLFDGRIFIGHYANGVGVMNVKGGVVNIPGGGGHLNAGYAGTGTLAIADTNSTITAGGWFCIPGSTGTGHVDLLGGTIDTNVFRMRHAGGTGTMDITGGTLIINGDQRTLVDGYIASGYITAFDGSGTVTVDYNNLNPGRTTVYAANKTHNWNANGTDDIWSNADNWTENGAPKIGETTLVNVANATSLIDSTVSANSTTLTIGSDTGPCYLNVSEGSLSLQSGYPVYIGRYTNGVGTINVRKAGTVNISGGAGHLHAGYYGSGTLTIAEVNSTITVGGWFCIPGSTGTGHVDLLGGTIDTNVFRMRHAGGTGTMDITGGTLIISGDQQTLVNGYITSGYITAYGGSGTVNVDYNVTNSGKTTVSASLIGTTISWDGGGSGNLWSTANNWDANGMPYSVDAVYISVTDANCVIDSTVYAACASLTVGNWYNTQLNVNNGGSFTVSGTMIIGRSGGSSTININDDTAEITTENLTIGWNGNGTLNVSSGTIDIKDWLSVPSSTGTGDGNINLDGGTISCRVLSLNSGATIDITQGALVVDDDKAELIQGYIDDGYITAYDGDDKATINVGYNSKTDKTTITATIASDNFVAYEPYPENNSKYMSAEITLSWTAGDNAAATNGHVLYFGTDYDAIANADANSPEYMGTFSSTSFTIPYDLPYNTTFYWAVDEVNSSDPTGPWAGDIWSFRARDDFPDQSFLVFMNSMLPDDIYIAVHAEERVDDTSSWTAVTSDYQPFKSRVDARVNQMYWHKDIISEDYYGELFTYDHSKMRLHAETFPAKTTVDLPSQPLWDQRIDRFRLFVEDGQSDWGKGRIIAPVTVDTSWTHTGYLDAYICNSFDELNNGTASQWQNNVYDYVTIEKVTNFSTVYDGLCTGWDADTEFTSFDEAIIINQHMGTFRERFIFARKGEKYYGIVRWDAAWYIDGRWQILNRTTGLRLKQATDFSFEGFEERAYYDRYLEPNTW